MYANEHFLHSTPHLLAATAVPYVLRYHTARDSLPSPRSLRCAGHDPTKKIKVTSMYNADRSIERYITWHVQTATVVLQ